ncbi:MAG: CZB domain-containing protein [Burkholderiales bacterium]|nr:CZB domain-containing protein [Burkholderiales bacterium]
MDLNAASQAHSEWKSKLRLAIMKKEALDAATITADNCCPLGKWLHGEAKTRFGTLGSYRDCVSKHAAFHREAGAVARSVNQKAFAAAEKMLESGSSFMTASTAVGSAILGLKKEAAL